MLKLIINLVLQERTTTATKNTHEKNCADKESHIEVGEALIKIRDNVNQHNA